jgi:hypothetical protein
MLDKLPKIPQPPTPSFAQIAKDKTTYLLITVVSLLWISLYFIFSSVSANDKNCLQEKNELRIELKEERKKNDNLVNAIFIKEGVIDRLSNITDSLNNNNHGKK